MLVEFVWNFNDVITLTVPIMCEKFNKFDQLL